MHLVYQGVTLLTLDFQVFLYKSIGFPLFINTSNLKANRKENSQIG